MHDLIVILGPTASGKTALAVKLAEKINSEIISADSRQIFRGMDIGTGKDLQEYGSVPYHLINIREAGELFNVSEFQTEFQTAYNLIVSKQKTPILCGGTGMYIHSIIQNHNFTQIPIDLELRKDLFQKEKNDLIDFIQKNNTKNIQFDISTHKRCIRAVEIISFIHNNPTFELNTEVNKINPVIFGLNPERETRRNRISTRLKTRFDEGMIEEVQNLLNKGIPADRLKFYGLEYKLIVEFLEENFTFNELFLKLETAIHQYAKRQMTFFRKMEKDGVEINWLGDLLNSDEKIDAILKKANL